MFLFMFTPILGEMIQFDYFSNRLKLPTSFPIKINFPMQKIGVLGMFLLMILYVSMVKLSGCLKISLGGCYVCCCQRMVELYLFVNQTIKTPCDPSVTWGTSNNSTTSS